MRQDAFADELRRAIGARGVTLTWLRERLTARGNTVSTSTLSYWQSGTRRPEGAASHAAVSDLEELLDLEPGALTALLGPARRAGPFALPVSPTPGGRSPSAAREVLDQLGAGNLSNVRSLSIQVVIEVDEHGHQRRLNERRLLQATSGVVTTFPYLLVAPTPKARLPVITALMGCAVVRTHVHPNQKVFGAALELAEPIATGETAPVEIAVDVSTGTSGENEYVMRLVRPVREFLLWIRFHPDKTPVWHEEFSTAGGRESSQPVEHGDARPVTSLHLARSGFGPGTIGLRWRFPDQGT